MNKADKYCKNIISDILKNGTIDKNPRPVWEDGTPAHSLSINAVMEKYDLGRGEFPAITLRPVFYKNAIKELFWIYVEQSNDLKLLREKYGINWWDDWALENDTIGACYGYTVRKHNLMNNLLESIEKDPDSRRHIINLWQEDDFKKPHGLKPCCYQVQFNVVNIDDKVRRLDMTLYQRSSDFIVAGYINSVQYAVLQCMVAHHFGMRPGIFTHFRQNVQIYLKHYDAAIELLTRESIPYEAYVIINSDKKNFFDLTPEDITIKGYPMEKIKEINPNIKLPVAI